MDASTAPSGCANGADDATGLAMSRHPLEIFPFFRRWRWSWRRDIIYTAIWNSLCAGVFAAVGLVFEPNASPVRMLMYNMVFAQCVGYSIHALFVVTDRLLPIARRKTFAGRVLYYSIVPIVGVYVGYWIASILLGRRDLQDMLLTLRGAVSIMTLAVVISGVLLAILIPRERAARAQVRIAQEEARVAAVEKEAAVARMQLLSAQVEPHFLYNTLAHVVSLIDSEPSTAKRMIDRLIALLRSTASAAGGTATLGGQLDHLRAYLDILELRMGARLTWTTDFPPELAPLAVPPMLLQPLVENAIKHGLEPKIEGGDVTITARLVGKRLQLTVVDTGLGFSALRNTASTGIGLANLRARLAALYGSDASLTIEDNSPSGARITLSLPIAETRDTITT